MNVPKKKEKGSVSMKSGLFISVLKRLSAKKKIYIFIYTGQTRFLREISKYTKKPTNPQYISNVN